jgi:hypothetical protein
MLLAACVSRSIVNFCWDWHRQGEEEGDDDQDETEVIINSSIKLLISYTRK